MGADKPNKSFYDPRKFIRAAEESMAARVVGAMERLGTVGKCGPEYATVVATSPAPKAWGFIEGSAAGTPAPATLGVVAAISALVGFAIAKAM
jgi:hypothetical protein